MSSLSKDKKVSIADMYYLGGPLSIRGFETRGIGPHSNGDALGAMSFWSGGLHLFAPLPFRPGKGGLGDLFRLHYFVNAGNIGNFKFCKYKLIVFKTLILLMYSFYPRLKSRDICIKFSVTQQSSISFSTN